MKIAFLHTAQVHIETFEALVDAIAPETVRTHHVAPELLASAQTDGLLSITAQTSEILEQLSITDAVLCTYSNLGPLADSFAQTHPNIVRIDSPMMEAAIETGAKLWLLFALKVHLTPPSHCWKTAQRKLDHQYPQNSCFVTQLGHISKQVI